MNILPDNSKLILNSRPQGTRVLSSIQQELRSCKSFRFCVAFVNQEGVACLIQTLADIGNLGVQGQVLVSQYLNFTDPVALRSLLKLNNLEVKIATEGAMHSKGYYFSHCDCERYIIGSSNWTASALSTNTELNIRVQTSFKSPLANEVANDFETQFTKAQPVTPEFVDIYEIAYNKLQSEIPSPQQGSTSVKEGPIEGEVLLTPNLMQTEALSSLSDLRANGKKKALIVSATGTGKTLLSAFDAKATESKRLLFVVHRENIARAAMVSYAKVFGHSRTYGLYTGNERNISADFIFSTVQTLSRPEHHVKFPPEHFDYIVVDESHRAGADSYARFLKYYQPGFLLGMTATPERTDGADIFRYFDYNIAYEIRLQHALEAGILCPFHYFGVSDLSVDGRTIEDFPEFNRLIAEERVERIIEKAQFYGCDDGIVRGLIFCSLVEEAISLSKAMNLRGYRTIALSGADSEPLREGAIQRLEAPEDDIDRLDYVLTVDIFNEGVDIPLVNQIILLRPTQSAIVFVQQLGRGLRKVQSKDKFLTVIDFIGNYRNNYLIPIALYGDRSYNKDRIRRLLVEANDPLPGTSTIDFDLVTKERIFQSVTSARTDLLSGLRADFDALQVRIGRLPMMMDFVTHDSRDPIAYSNSAKSFYSFALAQEPTLVPIISERAKKILEILSGDALNGKSLEEPLLLEALLETTHVSREELDQRYQSLIGLPSEISRWESAARSANLRFIRKSINGKLVSAGESIGVNWIEKNGEKYSRSFDFISLLQEATFKTFLQDLVRYARHRFIEGFEPNSFIRGFHLYRKYSRADVFRILGTPENPVAQNVGGYLIAPDQSWCPLFVTYKKDKEQAPTTQYEDEFLDQQRMRWFSKNSRYLSSPDVRFFHTSTIQQRILLFVQKSTDEGLEFYYLGDVRPDPEKFVQRSMPDGKGKSVPVVEMQLNLAYPVKDSLYRYITS